MTKTTNLLDVVKTIVANAAPKDLAVQVTTTEDGARIINVLNSESETIANATLYNEVKLVDITGKDVKDGIYALTSARFTKAKPESVEAEPTRSNRSGGGVITQNQMKSF